MTTRLRPVKRPCSPALRSPRESHPTDASGPTLRAFSRLASGQAMTHDRTGAPHGEPCNPCAPLLGSSSGKQMEARKGGCNAGPGVVRLSSNELKEVGLPFSSSHAWGVGGVFATPPATPNLRKHSHHLTALASKW
jgi:hypothetical protein